MTTPEDDDLQLQDFEDAEDPDDPGEDEDPGFQDGPQDSQQ